MIRETTPEESQDRWDYYVSAERRGLVLSTFVSGGILSAQTVESQLARKLREITPRETIEENRHVVDADTGEYLGGPQGTGAPYTIDGRKPYKLTFRIAIDGERRPGGFIMIRWFDSQEAALAACENAAAERSGDGVEWTPKSADLMSYSDYKNG